MAQLSDDCFNGPQGLTFLDEALRFFEQNLETVTSIGILPLDECLNRFVSDDIFSTLDIPLHRNSAVDGYLVHFDDLSHDKETPLLLIGHAKAGHPFAGEVPRGRALRVLTGAILPDGPDTIMMQEDCRLEDKTLFVKPGIKRGANLRKRGEDIRAGSLILSKGKRLSPQDIALAASIGLTSLPVHMPLRVAIFSTGDEVVDGGRPLAKGEIYDSNRMLVRLCLRKWGISISDLGILRDDPTEIRTAIEEAKEQADLILTTGGVSTGEEDHVRRIMQEIGRIHFWRLAIKPGRPIALGQIPKAGQQILFAGLPGNPVAAFVNLIHVIRPLLFQLMGADLKKNLLPRFTAIADFEWKKKSGRREWLRVKTIGKAEDGLPRLSRFPREGAGILSSLTESDGLAEIPESIVKISSGDKIDYLPFWGMW